MWWRPRRQGRLLVSILSSQLSSNDFKKIGGCTASLQPATVLLKSYTGNVIKCLEGDMQGKVGNQVNNINIRVVEGPSLLGKVLFTLAKYFQFGPCYSRGYYSTN